ncbi:DUF5518 domain-containing protein [Halorubrum sp. DTA46]|uniref:DUF5518 domain-containing protein n=1 Tax=Halorubrum sp. DTA46 TaxID=3402162 RepID=UPI003AAA645E
MYSTILGIVSFPELAGGFVAGYVHRRRGALVSTLSGIFAAVPKAGLLFLAITLFRAVSTESCEHVLVQFFVVLDAIAVFLCLVGSLAGYLAAYYYRDRGDHPGRSI